MWLDHLLSKEIASICRKTPVLPSETIPSWCTVGSVVVSSRSRFASLVHMYDWFCLLFRFEGADPSSRCEPWAREPATRHPRRRTATAEVAFVRQAILENCRASTSIFKFNFEIVFPSYKEPTVDALAPRTDEGRGRLRKATGSCLPSVDPWISEWGNPALVMECHSGLNT